MEVCQQVYSHRDLENDFIIKKSFKEPPEAGQRGDIYLLGWYWWSHSEQLLMKEQDIA